MNARVFSQVSSDLKTSAEVIFRGARCGRTEEARIVGVLALLWEVVLSIVAGVVFFKTSSLFVMVVSIFALGILVHDCQRIVKNLYSAQLWRRLCDHAYGQILSAFEQPQQHLTYYLRGTLVFKPMFEGIASLLFAAEARSGEWEV